MPGLGATINGLSTLRRTLVDAADGRGGGVMSKIEGFGPNPGALTLLAHVPKNLADGAPLVVVLHGCVQGAEAHAQAAGWLTLADRFGFVVLAPEQGAHNNANRCFNWFEPGDVRRGAGEAASIQAMTAHLVATHRLDPSRVFVTGLSAGGAMTAALLAAYPETFSAGAVVAGLPYGVAGNVQEALAVMRSGPTLDRQALARRAAQAAPWSGRPPRISIWHGLADRTVTPRNAQALADQWTEVHGLRANPDEMEVLANRTRSVWRTADGEAAVELNMIADLGHGAPLAAGGADPIGHVAAYMLEAGVSSALEIARFWGLAPPQASSAASEERAAPERDKAEGSVGVAADVMASISPHVAPAVRRIIADALRSSGLMR